MCGICGKLSWSHPPERDLVERMNRKIAHRGPDADGVKVIGPVTLGHRRLSIIDLSEAGNQPMTDVSERYWIVFNGEIYNFEDLRIELKKLGAQFRSRTDTEVILEAYKHWGASCLSRLNGMFAFALWDGPNHKLLLARDRLGKKPLYYQVLKDDGVVFASELKALCEDPAVSRQINPHALSQYFSLNYTLSSDCIFSGVQKLEAAHYMFIERGHPCREVGYWDLASCFQRKNKFRSDSEAAEALRELIDDSVRLRLISDVPLGLFLSGGVDSSTLAASMCQLRDPQDVHSFSIGFREKTFSELDEASEVAALFGMQHRDSVVLPDVVELLPKIIYHADEPFADTSIIPTYLLAEFCRKHVTVCLSGDGGDEIFGGYETYTADKIQHLTGWVPGWLTKSMYRIINRSLPANYNKVSWDYKLRHFLQGHSYPPMRAHYHWRTIFSKEEQKDLLAGSFQDVVEHNPFENFQKYQSHVADCHYLDQAMYVDIKTWLVDDILVKTDRSSMAHALEVRAPLLDYRIVEFAASLPVDLKIKAFEKKYILKKSQDGRISRRILNRKKKGFNAPTSHWIAGPLNRKFDEFNAGIIPGEKSIFNQKFIDTLRTDHLAKKQDNGFKLFSLLCFQIWVQQYQARLS